MTEAVNPGVGDEPQLVTVHDAVGGADFFTALVDDFYRRVADDERLRPSYPSDLGESKRTLTLFLIQYWGGPSDYSDERGHPRLRMRHAPFTIGMVERDAWLEHMEAAVAASGASAEVRHLLDQYFERASLAMINQPV